LRAKISYLCGISCFHFRSNIATIVVILLRS